MTARSPRYEIVRDAAGWHARFKAGNGAVIFWTETYRRRRTAEHAIDLLDPPLLMEIRVVDERYVPPPVVLVSPFYVTTIRPILDMHTRNARYADPEEFWHDREYHYRQCTGTEDQGGDCTEGTPPLGTMVRGRSGEAKFTAEHVAEAAEWTAP